MPLQGGGKLAARQGLPPVFVTSYLLPQLCLSCVCPVFLHLVTNAGRIMMVVRGKKKLPVR